MCIFSLDFCSFRPAYSGVFYTIHLGHPEELYTQHVQSPTYSLSPRFDPLPDSFSQWMAPAFFPLERSWQPIHIPLSQPSYLIHPHVLLVTS